MPNIAVPSMVGDEYLESLLERAQYNGIDSELYEKIAVAFTRGADECSSQTVIQLLRLFVAYSGDPIYVNEIKHLLQNRDEELFKAYAQHFTDCLGSREVFGVDPVNPRPVEIESESEEEEKQKRETKYGKKRKRIKKRIRSEARKEAIEKHRNKIEKGKEKKEKRAEFESLLRKMNGA